MVTAPWIGFADFAGERMGVTTPISPHRNDTAPHLRRPAGFDLLLPALTCLAGTLVAAVTYPERE